MKENIVISDGKSWFKRGYAIESKIMGSIIKVILIFPHFDLWSNKVEIVEFLKSVHGEPGRYIASTYVIEKEKIMKFLSKLGV